MIHLLKENDDAFRFSLRTEGGQILLTSIRFATQLEMETAIKNLTTLKPSQNIYERKTDHEGNFLFCVKDTHGKAIGNSESYYSEAGMENGIKNLKAAISQFGDTVVL